MLTMPDTSVLVAAILHNHPMHTRALPLLASIHAGEREAVVAAHTLAEVYSTMTRMPTKPAITPSQAFQLIEVNVLAYMRVVALSASDYPRILKQMAANNLGGGIVYDALILHAARENAVEQIVTFNTRHFHRVAPDLAAIIVEP